MTSTQYPTTRKFLSEATLRIDPDGRGIWLGERHLPWAQVESLDHPMMAFDGGPLRIRQAKVPFENGLVLSIVWGTGSYSTNHDAITRGGTPFVEQPYEVEIAVLNGEGFVRLAECDDVLGYVGVAELAAALDHIGTLPSSTKALGRGFQPIDENDAGR